MTTRARVTTRDDVDEAKCDGAGLTSVQWATLMLVVFAHLLVVEALILVPTWLVPTTDIPTILAVPITQNALMMLWCMAGGGRSYVRFPIAIMATIGIWCVTIRFLGTDVAVGGPYLMAGFAAESTVVFVGMFGLQQWIARGSKGMQYGIFAVMSFTAFIAIVLGFLRLSHQWWGWTIGLASTEHFWVLPYYFAGCGLVAVAALLTLSAPLPRRVCIVLIVVSAVGYGIPASGSLIWKTQDFISNIYKWIITWELCILYATLLPLRFLFVRLVVVNPSLNGEPKATASHEAVSPSARR